MAKAKVKYESTIFILLGQWRNPDKFGCKNKHIEWTY